MLIAIVNQSTMVSNDQVNTMTQAIQIQLDLHMLPAWNLKAGTIRFYSDIAKVPGYAWTIYIIDSDAQVAGALGFHQEDGYGKINGYIMCEPILSNGGTALVFDPANPGQYTVSATLSHEVLETIGDRYTNLYSDNGGTSWCNELCDPVEQVGYGIKVGSTLVSVSDFVFPSFFNPDAILANNAPFNYLDSLKTPFSILSGGYAIIRTGGPGTEQQVFGETMPQWRKDAKTAAFSRLKRITNIK